jgi:hypothetical protein
VRLLTWAFRRRTDDLRLPEREGRRAAGE